MSPLPDREALEAMKRIDLQKLCKDYGVKANLKTEALIDLLLNEAKPPSVRPTPQPAQRSVSTRRTSSLYGARPRGRSGASMIVHDTEDEEEPEDEVPAEPEPEPEPTPPPATRTRKAKETQTRLGVGRPLVAGGSGARAVTKSLSVSKNKRGKSKSTKPTEPTIPEEEPEPTETTRSQPINASEPGPSASRHELPDAEQFQRLTALNDNAFASLEVVDKHVADALRPIHEQLQSLKSELEQMHSLKTEVEQLKTRVADMSNLQLKVDTLTVEVEDLRARSNAAIAMSTSGATVLGSAFKSPAKKASGSGTLSFGVPSSLKPAVMHEFNIASGSNTLESIGKPAPPHPGFAPTTLGKRHRDSNTSNVTGVFDEGHEDEFSETELAKKVARPTKKRAKITYGEAAEQQSSNQREGESSRTSSNQYATAEEEEEEEEEEEAAPNSRLPSFTVFSGPEEPPETYIDPPPPTTHLPDTFAPGSPPSTRPTTSTAHASENQNPFTFSFLPHSTPAQSLYPLNMPSFPYPEPPQSPSPAGPSSITGHPAQRGGSRPDRSIFQTFGAPARPRSRAAAEAGGIDPAALSRPSSRTVEREPSSNEVAVGLGLTAVRVASDAPAEQTYPPMKRTMYGTELEGDTRFGDFGVEGVGSGFWF